MTIRSIREDIWNLHSSNSNNSVEINKQNLTSLPLSERHYLTLSIGANLWMNNLVSEDNSHALLESSAYGDVLLGGLGFGSDVLLLRDKPLIDTICVVETDIDVIELVWTLVSSGYPNLSVYNDSLSNYLQTTTKTFDMVWIDIFTQFISELPEEEALLIQQAQRVLKPNGKILFWKDADGDS